jgi:hypothetical protein
MNTFVWEKIGTFLLEDSSYKNWDSAPADKNLGWGTQQLGIYRVSISAVGYSKNLYQDSALKNVHISADLIF